MRIVRRIMILGFLGKGGSGKTTTATRVALLAHERGRRVLAIDADHNMDLAFNLEYHEPFPYFGSSLDKLREHCGLAVDQDYRDALAKNTKSGFSLSPLDQYTAAHSREARNGIRLMVAGPHTEAVLFDQSCSHSLSTPLKVYLPLLRLYKNEVVIVDEKAGLDGVGTGIPTGFTAAIIVSEPTPHSIKAAHGIRELLDFFGTPYRFVVTKVQSQDDIERSRAAFGDLLIGHVPLCAEPLAANENVYDSIIAFGEQVAELGDQRLVRSLSKIARNHAFQAKLTH